VDSEQGTAGEQGSGLGLNLCKEFIELQGGKIWLDEHYNEGTKIVFSLPESAA
jgi:signal transduction histidine kinase